MELFYIDDPIKTTPDFWSYEMIEIKRWDEELKNANYDDNVGIRIAKLLSNNDFNTFITVIDPKKYVTPHYHKHGDEHYHIISGSGTLKLKSMLNSNEKTFLLNEGESFSIPENTMHQLINTGTKPLTLMFSCPDAHLEVDRYFS